MTRRFACLMLIAGAGCSVGTDPAGGPGTESWERAKQSFDRGQYAEVVPELEHAALPGSPFQEAATVWRLVLLGGLARGYLTLAGSHAEREGGEAGASADRYFAEADEAAARYAKALGDYQQLGGAGPVILAFGFPKGPLTPPGLGAAEDAVLAHAVIQETAALAGYPGDPGRALREFKPREVSVPRKQFEAAIAATCARLKTLYESRFANPERRLLFEEAAARMGAQ